MVNPVSCAERAALAAASVVLSPSASAACCEWPDVVARAEAERVRASIEAELEHVAVLGYN
jgi:hypothetical protein